MDPQPPPDEPARRPWLVAWLAVAALAAAVPFSVPFLLTSDGPQTLLSSYMMNHYADADAPYRALLEPNFPITSRGFDLVFNPLEPLLGWRRALQVFQALVGSGTVLAFGALARRLDPRRAWLMPLGGLYAYGWTYYMGLYAFTMSSVLGVTTVAYALRRRGLGAWPLLVVAALLTVTAFLHVFGAVLAAGVIATSWVLGPARWGAWRTRLLKALVPLTPVLLFQGWAWLRSPAAFTVEVSEDGWYWMEWPRGLLAWLHTVGPGRWPTTALMALVLVAAGASLGGRVWGRRLRPEERGVALMGSAMVVLGLLAPLHVPGWQLFSPRFVGWGSLLLGALVEPGVWARPRARLWRWVPTVAALAGLGGAFGQHRFITERCAGALTALQAGPQWSGSVLPMVLDERCGLGVEDSATGVAYQRPLLHYVAALAVVQGGVPTYLFASDPSIHPFRKRVGAFPPAPDWFQAEMALQSVDFKENARFRAGMIDEFAVDGSLQEGITYLGDEALVRARLEERGYRLKWSHDLVSLFQFQGCELELLLPARWRSVPLHLTLADTQESMAFESATRGVPLLEVAERHGSRLAHRRFKAALCGKVLLEFGALEDGSHPPCPGMLPGGKLPVLMTPHARLDCRGPEPSGAE